MENNKKQKVVIGTIITAVIMVLLAVSHSQKTSEEMNTSSQAIGTENIEIKAEETKKDPLKNNNITFFTQDGCIYCKYAMDYIADEYPGLEMKVINVRSGRGFEQLKTEARKKGITSVGTPFILLGDNDYIIGWGDANVKKFNAYIDSLK